VKRVFKDHQRLYLGTMEDDWAAIVLYQGKGYLLTIKEKSTFENSNEQNSLPYEEIQKRAGKNVLFPCDRIWESHTGLNWTLRFYIPKEATIIPFGFKKGAQHHAEEVVPGVWGYYDFEKFEFILTNGHTVVKTSSVEELLDFLLEPNFSAFQSEESKVTKIYFDVNGKKKSDDFFLPGANRYYLFATQWWHSSHPRWFDLTENIQAALSEQSPIEFKACILHIGSYFQYKTIYNKTDKISLIKKDDKKNLLQRLGYTSKRYKKMGIVYDILVKDLNRFEYYIIAQTKMNRQWYEFEKIVSKIEFALNEEKTLRSMFLRILEKINYDKKRQYEKQEEIKHVKSLLRKHSSEDLTIQDSIDAGNCEVGTRNFIKNFNIKRDSLKCGTILKSYPKMIEDYQFRRVVLKKFEK